MFDERKYYMRDDEMDEFGDTGAYGDPVEEDFEEEEEESDVAMTEDEEEAAPKPVPRLFQNQRPWQPSRQCPSQPLPTPGTQASSSAQAPRLPNLSRPKRRPGKKPRLRRPLQKKPHPKKRLRKRRPKKP